jgi:hypothetical protein
MLNLQKRHQALHQMVRVGVQTQWLDRDHGMPAGDIGWRNSASCEPDASHALREDAPGRRWLIHVDYRCALQVRG